MRKPIFSAILVVLLAGLIVSGVAAQKEPDPDKGKAGTGQICITFDDLPVARVHDRIERLMITDRILFTLDEFGVKAAGFVIGDNIEGDADILGMWLQSGHVLGNHTFSHPDLSEVPPDLYIKDIEKGQEAIEDLLVNAKQGKRYFRYPFLHCGNTFAAKKAVKDHLGQKDYIDAPVTVDTDDFAFNLQYEKIRETADSLEIVRLGREYIDHILERLAAAETLAKTIMGRKVKHIVLLHANRLNAEYLPPLLTAIQDRGYTFISLPEALSDPIFSIEDSYVGPKGLSVLERLEKTDPDLLPARE